MQAAAGTTVRYTALKYMQRCTVKASSYIAVVYTQHAVSQGCRRTSLWVKFSPARCGAGIRCLAYHCFIVAAILKQSLLRKRSKVTCKEFAGVPAVQCIGEGVGPAVAAQRGPENQIAALQGNEGLISIELQVALHRM